MIFFFFGFLIELIPGERLLLPTYLIWQLSISMCVYVCVYVCYREIMFRKRAQSADDEGSMELPESLQHLTLSEFLKEYVGSGWMWTSLTALTPKLTARPDRPSSPLLHRGSYCMHPVSTNETFNSPYSTELQRVFCHFLMTNQFCFFTVFLFSPLEQT